MTIIFGSSPADAEPDGSTPDDWTNESLNTFEIDDGDIISPYSGSKCIMAGASGATQKAHADLGATQTVLPVFVAMDVNDSTDVMYFALQENTGNWVGTDLCVELRISGGYLQYYDTTWNNIVAHSSGYIYLKIVPDFINDDFDIWKWDGSWSSIGVDLGMRDTASSNYQCVQIAVNNGDTVGYDAIQIGEQPCTITPAQAGPMSGGVTI